MGDADFSLTVAARSLAAATTAYLEPQSRGLTFSAYDAVVKEALRPPFSEVAVHDGNDSTNTSHSISNGGEEERGHKADEGHEHVELAADGKEIQGMSDLQKRLNGCYDIQEIYDRTGKQTVRCLCAVVHGKYLLDSRPTNHEVGPQDLSGNYQPGNISITFRGTDTLANVLVDVQFLTVPYDAKPFDPTKAQDSQKGNLSETDVDAAKEETARKEEDANNSCAKSSTCRATVHTGFRDAWYGDNLRSKVMRYICEQVDKLHHQNLEAESLGLKVPDPLPTIDITGHSLGGSIAVLAAYDLAKSISMPPNKKARIRVYVHGCPRVGNGWFAQQFNDLVPNCWNIINDNDIVPAIPHTHSWGRCAKLCVCLSGSKKLKNVGYQRQGRVVILKSNGHLIVDPTRRQKYRREAKVLRVPKAIKSHETGEYRSHIRSAIQSKTGASGRRCAVGYQSKIDGSRKKEAEEKMKRLDELLDRLEQVIVESRSDPRRSLRLLPGAT